VIRVIIDADPGVDDAAAILLALASPEVDVLGLSIVSGNVPLTDAVANACKVVGVSGRRNLPIHAGASAPLIRDQIFGKYAAIGTFADALVPPTDVVPEVEHAVRFLVRTLRAAASAGDPITICAIGPMTNLALALVHHPEVAQGIARIVTMGGTFRTPGHRVPWAEFNVLADPHAADVVYRSGVPIVAIPLDLTTQALFTHEHFTSFRERGGAAGAALGHLFTAFDRSDVARYGRPGGPIHDAATLAWLIRPELFESRAATVGVQLTGEMLGATYADYDGVLHRAPNAQVATRIDEAGFITLLTERIAFYGDRAAGSLAPGVPI